MTIQLHKTSSLTIALAKLRQGTPGITSSFGGGLAEAASVCLDDRGHQDPTSMQVDGAVVAGAAVRWDRPTEQALRCWNDGEVATEHGAYGVAALLVPEISDLHIIERARKGKGFDFWLGRQDDPGPLFQNKARMEVSGLRSGTEADLGQRVKRKSTQIDQSKGMLPGLVVVVEFGQPRTRVIVRE